MSFLKNTIKNTISQGVSKGLSQAIGSAVERVVAPSMENWANKTAESIREATPEVSQSSATVRSSAPAESGFAGLGAAFSGLESAMSGYAAQAEKYATNLAAGLKQCPACGEATTADKKFCPFCGAKLPDKTLGDDYICPACGKQNTIGTAFCAECGAKLPGKAAEEQAAKDKDAAVLAQFAEKLSEYPVWHGAGYNYAIEDLFTDENGNVIRSFTYHMPDNAAAYAEAMKYRELLLAAGFNKAYDKADDRYLYKNIGGVWHSVDLEHVCVSDDGYGEIKFAFDKPYIPAPENDNAFDFGDAAKELKNGLKNLKKFF